MIPDDILAIRSKLRQRKRWPEQFDPFTWSVIYYGMCEAMSNCDRKIAELSIIPIASSDRARDLRRWKNSLKEYRRMKQRLARIGNAHNWQ